MPISHNIWRVGQSPAKLQECSLSSEKLLEDMIVAAPEILSDQWMIIGRQEDTGFGGRIDLLAIAPDASLILIELKRNKTPREVVAQAIDYATWLEKLDAEEIARIYFRYSQGGDLAKDFKTRFDSDLDETNLNQSHQIVIVASSLDSSSERIVGYLNQRDIPINVYVLCFQLFESGNDQLLSRAWLLDPTETQISANVTSSKAAKEPWNGEYYVSFGHGLGRSWPDAATYGFVSAGGGSWYSNTLNLLKPGDRIWVKAPGYGFVGVGRVKGPPEPAKDFKIKVDGQERPALDVLKSASYRRGGLLVVNDRLVVRHVAEVAPALLVFQKAVFIQYFQGGFLSLGRQKFSQKLLVLHFPNPLIFQSNLNSTDSLPPDEDMRALSASTSLLSALTIFWTSESSN